MEVRQILWKNQDLSNHSAVFLMKKLIILILGLISLEAIASNYQFDLTQYNNVAADNADFFTNDLMYKSCSKLEDANFD